MLPKSANRLLSVVVVVRSAADALEETLSSVRAVADEIVVVDTGSTDATCQVAERAGVKLLHRAWDDDFSAARNFAADHASGRWLFTVDAGERLSLATAQGLRAWLEGRREEKKAYLVTIKLPRAETHLAAEQAARIRLVPNGLELRYTGRVRESLLPALAEAGYTVEHTPFALERGPRALDPQAKLRKARRDLALATLAIEDDGLQAHWLIAQGEAWHTLGDPPRAADVFRDAIRHCRRGSTDMLEAFYGLLTALDADPRQRQAQISTCLQALEVFPLDAQLLCALGGYLQAQGRLDLAARSYETAHRFGQINPETWHMAEIYELAVGCHALTLELQDRADSARDVLTAGLADHPHSIRLRRQLIELHIARGQHEEAVAHIAGLPASSAEVELLQSAVRGACLAAQGQALPALSYLQVAYNNGCRDPLCLRWLAVARLTLGEATTALALLREWKAVDPYNADVQRILAATAEEDIAVAPPRESPLAAPGAVRFDTPAPALQPHPLTTLSPVPATR